MEVVLIHPDVPEVPFTATSQVELEAFKGQGFIEKDVYEAGAGIATDGKSEVEQLREELAETREQLGREIKAREDAEAELKDTKKELKTERARNTRETNKDKKDEAEQLSEKTPAKEESENN